MLGNDNDKDRSGKRGPPSVVSGDESDLDPLAERGANQDQRSDEAVAEEAIELLRKTPTAKLGEAAKTAAKGSATKHLKK